jgi:cholera toxin transcriptional activator
MDEHKRPIKCRFAAWELDLRTSELRKNGEKIPLQDKPAKLLILLATHAGTVVTRMDIQKALWPDGEFVGFQDAINTAMKKVREALGDDADTPTMIETVPRQGYRFIAAVEYVYDDGATDGENRRPDYVLPVGVARVLFLIIQVGYIWMYIAALTHREYVEEALTAASLGPVEITSRVVVITAMCGIAIRLFLLSAVGLCHQAAGEKFKRLFPVVLVLDSLWAASPILAGRTIGFDFALVAVAGLAYLPFTQRTLVQTIYPAPFVAANRGVNKSA